MLTGPIIFMIWFVKKEIIYEIESINSKKKSLSLAAVSAAEATSSGKRGLREKTSIWLPIGIITGTAVVGLLIGGISGYFIRSCPSGYKLPSTVSATTLAVIATGCKKGHYQGAALAEKDPVAVACTDCATLIPGSTTSGSTDFTKAAPTTGTNAQNAAVCPICTYGYWPKKADSGELTCQACAIGGGATDSSLKEVALASAKGTKPKDHCQKQCIAAGAAGAVDVGCVCVKTDDPETRELCPDSGTGKKCNFTTGKCDAS
jgi:hypothetical protein